MGLFEKESDEPSRDRTWLGLRAPDCVSIGVPTKVRPIASPELPNPPRASRAAGWKILRSPKPDLASLTTARMAGLPDGIRRH